MVVSLPSAKWTTMKPPPPILPARGKVTASAKPTATAASTALPPFCRMSAPTRAAKPSCATTMPACPTTLWPATLCPTTPCASVSAPSGARSSPRATKGSTRLAASAKRRRRRGAKTGGCIGCLMLGLQHRRQNAIGRTVTVKEGLDVDNDLLAHVDAAFKRGRREMRQQHHFAGARELDEF